MGAPSFQEAIASIRIVIAEAEKHPRGLVRSVALLDEKSAIVDAYLGTASVKELADRVLLLAAEGLWTCRALSSRLPRWQKRLSVMQHLVGVCPLLPAHSEEKKRKRPSKAELAPVVRFRVLLLRYS